MDTTNIPNELVVPSVKSAWLSKTFLFNTTVGLLLLAEDNVSGLQGLLPPSKYQIVAFALPMVNLVLRYYTNQGVTFKRATPAPEVTQ